MVFSAELKLHILSMIDDPKPRNCRSIVNVCHSNKKNRALCAENINSLWKLVGFDPSIQPKNMTTFAHECYRETHNVLQYAHNLLLSVQEYKVQNAISKISSDPAKPVKPYYYYKSLPKLPSLKNISIRHHE